VESVSVKRPGLIKDEKKKFLRNRTSNRSNTNLCTGGLDCEVFVDIVSVFDAFADAANGPFFKSNISIKFGIIEKFDGSVNDPGIGGKDDAPITSKLTAEGLFV
jgi:hypothetical protein